MSSTCSSRSLAKYATPTGLLLFASADSRFSLWRAAQVESCPLTGPNPQPRLRATSCEQTLGLIPALQLAHNQKTAPTSRLTRAPHRSPFVAIARTAGALTNPLEHQVECSYGAFKAGAG